MKINEVTDNQRLDELWPQAVAVAGAIGKIGSKLFSKSPKKIPKATKTNKADFDDIPLPQKVTGKVHADPKMGNVNKWKNDSNLHLQSK